MIIGGHIVVRKTSGLPAYGYGGRITVFAEHADAKGACRIHKGVGPVEARAVAIEILPPRPAATAGKADDSGAQS